MPAPAPRVLAHSDPLGIVALEDLGDVTLQARLGSASPEEARALYVEAVDLIHLLQRRGRELASPEYVPYTLAFDTEKLLWELRFFVTHFLEGHRGCGLAESARQALDAEWLAVAEELSSEPRVLCHRDYHSRNLMVHDGRLWLIDYQDARLGPDTYDLASLLRDSYIELDGRRVDELIDRFVALRGPAAPDEAGTEFRRRFDLMSVQRNIKALGTFGFQASVRGNTSYLQYVPRTLGYVRANLVKYPRFARLHELLAAGLPELRT
jgi:aminoglycoside/choline kinase family phosphotransferase